MFSNHHTEFYRPFNLIKGAFTQLQNNNNFLIDKLKKELEEKTEENIVLINKLNVVEEKCKELHKTNVRLVKENKELRSENFELKKPKRAPLIISRRTNNVKKKKVSADKKLKLIIRKQSKCNVKMNSTHYTPKRLHDITTASFSLEKPSLDKHPNLNDKLLIEIIKERLSKDQYEHILKLINSIAETNKKEVLVKAKSVLGDDNEDLYCNLAESTLFN